VAVGLNCTRQQDPGNEKEDDVQNLMMLGQAALGLGVFFHGRGGTLVRVGLSGKE